MGILFNKKRKAQEIDNEYALNNLQLEDKYTELKMVNRDYIEVSTVFSPKCDKNFSFVLNWDCLSDESFKKNIDKDETKFVPAGLNSPTIELRYKVFPNGVGEGEIIINDSKSDDEETFHVQTSLGKLSDLESFLEDQYDMPTEIRKFFFKVIKTIDFKKDINFVSKFVKDKEELERKLKHIDYKEVENSKSTDVTNKIKQIDEQISMLIAQRDKLTKTQIDKSENTSFENSNLEESINRKK